MDGNRTNFDKSTAEHFNLVILKKGGEKFEISVDPELAMKFRHGEDIDIHSVLKVERIFKDAKKGLAASGNKMKDLFNTNDVLKVAELIIKEGEIQLSQKFREQFRELRYKRIIGIIHQNGVNAKTGAPIPLDQIESAIKAAKIRIDEHRTPEDQVNRIVKDLQSLLPLKLELKELDVKVPADIAGKAFHYIKNISNVVKDTWNADGSVTCTVQIPAGLLDEFISRLNAFTKGDVEVSRVRVH